MFFLGQTSLGLKTDLDDICRVGNRDTKSTSGHTGRDLLKKGRVHSGFKGSSNQVTDGHIQTNTDTSVESLALKARDQTIEESTGAFFSGNLCHGAEETTVARDLTRCSILELETNFGGIKRNGANFTDRASKRAHTDIAEEEPNV